MNDYQMDELLTTIQTYDYYQMCELSMATLRAVTKYYGLKPAKTKRILSRNLIRFMKDMRPICPICMDTVADTCIITECHHVFCDSCILQHIKTGHKGSHDIKCPICRKSCDYTHIMDQMEEDIILEINKTGLAIDNRNVDFSMQNGLQGFTPDGTMSIFQSGYLFISVMVVMIVFIIETTILVIVCYVIAKVILDDYINRQVDTIPIKF